MTALVSALYEGTVVHRRFAPVQHRLRYRIFNLLLDLDELPRLDRELRLFSHNRRNLFALNERDHLAGSAVPLRAQVEGHLAAAGIAPDGGPIRLLCMPRLLGSAFNPLSLWFCHGRDGALRAILYEVNNTFGERHSYLLPVGSEPGMVRQDCAKTFHVSPFLGMDLTYHFRVAPPAETLSVAIEVRDSKGPVLRAAFGASRATLDDAALLRTFLAHPLLTLKVLGGIHWEAVKLWRKGVRIHARPPAPELPVTFQSLPASVPEIATP